MAALFEVDQVGKRDSLADLVSCVEAEACPFSSMMQKRSKPSQRLHHWQAKNYPRPDHVGVVDGKDAENFSHNPREELYARSQKLWQLPAVSDFAEESEVAGVPRGEMAEQVADSLVGLKRGIEMRVSSNDESQADNGNDKGGETRGIFCWVQNGAQTDLPVPVSFRTPSASIHTGTNAALTETVFKELMRSAYKQRKGASKLDGFCGVDLKGVITEWSGYQDNVTSKTAVRTLSQDADKKMLLSVVDRLVLDTGTVDLHLTSFNYTDPATGADSAYTHKSGIFVDMSMVALAFTRKPRVVKLEYKGGGYKAIVDAIVMLMMDNPLGHVAVKSNT